MARRVGFPVFLVLAALPPLGASECRLAVGSDALPVREVFVNPSVVSLPVGGAAAVEGFGRDEFSGVVSVRLEWASADPGIASVAPSHASITVITAVAPGKTIVTAIHPGSGASDTVQVEVTDAPR